MLVLSRKDIEAISRKVLSSYLHSAGRKLNSIDPIDFAEKMCGIKFEFAEMGDNGKVLGLTAFSEVEVTIPCGNGQGQVFKLNGRNAFVDQSLLEGGNVGRLNFTMMHEAAHQLLGLLFPEEYNFKTQPFICRLADEYCRQPITDWPEWQTNVLTSCLLLPRELVKKQMAQHGLGEHIRLLNRVFAPKDYERFSEMADDLGVSKTTLSIRLNQLGMVGRNDFYDPYALVNVYVDEDEIA